MKRLLPWLAFLAMVLSGTLLVLLQQEVQARKARVAALMDDIRADKQAIRVLRAEWAYLTTPDLLQKRALDFLALMPPHPDQVMSDPGGVPLRPVGVAVAPLPPGADRRRPDAGSSRSGQGESGPSAPADGGVPVPGGFVPASHEGETRP
ncbi:cell division protein FtsL [Yunchengibacter salinarum]|uniref:cell division protein FtsL n=1 Tax=Yunchengibacter salinarum TaxID=3133399 RepID=UPI0035B585F7